MAHNLTLYLTGTGIAILTVIVLIIRWSVEEFGYEKLSWDNTKHWKQIVDFLIIGVTVLVVAVPEGLPLAVTLALAYSVRVRVRWDPLLQPAAYANFLVGVVFVGRFTQYFFSSSYNKLRFFTADKSRFSEPAD